MLKKKTRASCSGFRVAGGLGGLRHLVALVIGVGVLVPLASAQEENWTVPRKWCELAMESIRNDFARPTVHARNLHHISAAMYDAWALYEDRALGFLVDYDLPSDDKVADQEEALSFAVYRIMQARFSKSPGAEEVLPLYDNLMDELGYDKSFYGTVGDSPAAWGNGVIVIDSTYPESPTLPGMLHVLPNALLAGTTREPPRGMQKFEWLPEEDRFVEDWYLEYPDNTDWMPPAISPQTGLAYIAHKEDNRYEYQAIDWDTGELVARWRFPDDSVLWNTWGGITTLLSDGDLLLGGFFAVKRFDVGHLSDTSEQREPSLGRSAIAGGSSGETRRDTPQIQRDSIPSTNQ